MLIDAHLHFQDIKDERVLAGILDPAPSAGIGRFLCNGIRPEDWPRVEAIAYRDERIVPFFGVHPWNGGQVAEGWEVQLEKMLEIHPGAGIGEVGLDRARAAESFERQKQVFRAQLAMAGRLSRPVAVHCARAWGELLTALRAQKPAGLRCMVHSFNGSAGVLREFLDLGAFISFSWKILRDKSDRVLELVRRVPDDRLLLETDFPYTEPGKIGEDADAAKYFRCLHETYAIVAEARETGVEILQKTVWDNGTSFLH
ncbi:MAG TPA: TatD family hydrolase [Candidatus Omnitrophota bacterium]|nr:TatD family hydrolase [Candidatus Omnitrophota bacterium]HPS36981.1 TatD family hydrolase [Candidatus Omnitrophota bacterium]